MTTEYLDYSGLQHIVNQLFERGFKGLGLSKNDFTDSYKAVVESAANGGKMPFTTTVGASAADNDRNPTVSKLRVLAVNDTSIFHEHSFAAVPSVKGSDGGQLLLWIREVRPDQGTITVLPFNNFYTGTAINRFPAIPADAKVYALKSQSEAGELSVESVLLTSLGFLVEELYGRPQDGRHPGTIPAGSPVEAIVPHLEMINKEIGYLRSRLDAGGKLIVFDEHYDENPVINNLTELTQEAIQRLIGQGFTPKVVKVGSMAYAGWYIRFDKEGEVSVWGQGWPSFEFDGQTIPASKSYHEVSQQQHLDLLEKSTGDYWVYDEIGQTGGRSGLMEKVPSNNALSLLTRSVAALEKTRNETAPLSNNEIDTLVNSIFN